MGKSFDILSSEFYSSCFTDIIPSTSLRSLSWKLHFNIISHSNPLHWILQLTQQRTFYSTLLSPQISPSNNIHDISTNNPLSDLPNNPWTQKFIDLQLENIIRQDVERTFPEIPIFREKHIQDLLTLILLSWSKMEPQISYRQGMHELLAIIYLVVETDSLIIPLESTDSTDPTILSLFNPDFIIHDCAILFFKLMQSAKIWYKISPDIVINTTVSKTNTKEIDMPIIITCKRIQNELLKILDLELYRHLEHMGIEPQLYGIRWIRLLFSREFPMSETLILWDSIFQDDLNLSLVEWICASMILSIRSQLLNGDYSNALTLLLRFPTADITAKDIIHRAKELKLLFKAKTTSTDSIENITNHSKNLNIPSQLPSITISSSNSLRNMLENANSKLKQLKNRNHFFSKNIQNSVQDISDVMQIPNQNQETIEKLSSVLDSLNACLNILGPSSFNASGSDELNSTELNLNSFEDKLNLSESHIHKQTDKSIYQFAPLLDSADASVKSLPSAEKVVESLKAGFTGFNKVISNLFDESNSKVSPQSKSQSDNTSSTKLGYAARPIVTKSYISGLSSPKNHYDLSVDGKDGRVSQSVKPIYPPPASKVQPKSEYDPLGASKI